MHLRQKYLSKALSLTFYIVKLEGYGGPIALREII